MIRKLLLLTSFAIFFFSCGDSGKKNNSLTSTDATQRNEYESVNVNEQQKPTLMVIPSDALLKRLGFLKIIENQGITSYQRDYQKALIEDTDLKYVITEIQSAFIEVGFPLEDLEQSLKSIQNELALDNVDNVKKDAKTLLLNTARPDIILELEYDAVIDSKSRNLEKSVTYSIKAIDCYSNKTVATIQNANISGSDKISTVLKDEINSKKSDLTTQISNHFADIIRNGREITLRIAVESGIEFDFTDDCVEGEDYSEMINNWLKDNTFGGSFKRDRATDVELRFKNVRIKTLDENGRQFTAYDFANELKKAMKKMCGLKSSNNTQSLSDAYLQIKGM